MRVLVVARCKKGRFAPFITEQVESLKRQGVECRFWGIQGNGLLGYLRQWPDYRRTLRQYRPDVVHAHFVFSGLLACLQNRVPVVTTYHGSDINERLLLPLSRLVIALSAWNVFVSRQNYEVVLCKRKYSIKSHQKLINTFPPPPICSLIPIKSINKFYSACARI